MDFRVHGVIRPGGNDTTDSNGAAPAIEVEMNATATTTAKRSAKFAQKGAEAQRRRYRHEEERRKGNKKRSLPPQLIDARIKELCDWRGETLARVRALIRQADPGVVERTACFRDGHRIQYDHYGHI
jgi:hypothetical protein